MNRAGSEVVYKYNGYAIVYWQDRDQPYTLWHRDSVVGFYYELASAKRVLDEEINQKAADWYQTKAIGG